MFCNELGLIVHAPEMVRSAHLTRKMLRNIMFLCCRALCYLHQKIKIFFVFGLFSLSRMMTVIKICEVFSVVKN